MNLRRFDAFFDVSSKCSTIIAYINKIKNSCSDIYYSFTKKNVRLTADRKSEKLSVDLE